MDRLLGILGREVEALELVIHRATVLTMLLAAGSTRFLVPASDDLDAAARELGELDAWRAIVVSGIASRRRLAADATLADLAEAVGGDLGRLLRDLGGRLTALTSEVDERLAAADELAATGLGTVRGVMEQLATGHHAPVYGGPTVTEPTRFDQRA